MKSLRIALLAVFVSPVVANAQVAFSSIGPGKTWSGNSYVIAGPTSGVGGVIVGNRFSSEASGPLSSVEVALAHTAGTPNAMEVKLHHANGAGEIGTLIESWTVSNLPPIASGGGLFALTSVTGGAITTGADYWISVWPGGDAMQGNWMISRGPPVTQLPLASSGNGGATFQYNDVGGAMAFQVNVPEPSTVLSFIVGGLLLLNLRRYRAR